MRQPIGLIWRETPEEQRDALEMERKITSERLRACGFRKLAAECLANAGFETVAEIRAADDAELRARRIAVSKMIADIRTIAPYTGESLCSRCNGSGQEPVIVDY